MKKFQQTISNKILFNAFLWTSVTGVCSSSFKVAVSRRPRDHYNHRAYTRTLATTWVVETRSKDLRWILHSKRFKEPSPPSPPWMRIRIVSVGCLGRYNNTVFSFAGALRYAPPPAIIADLCVDTIAFTSRLFFVIFIFFPPSRANEAHGLWARSDFIPRTSLAHGDYER